MAKRRPTRYSILVDGSADLETLSQQIHLVGDVEAFTPDQARRRAVDQIPAVAALAADVGGTVQMRAVPSGSMIAHAVEVKSQAVLQGGGRND